MINCKAGTVLYRSPKPTHHALFHRNRPICAARSLWGLKLRFWVHCRLLGVRRVRSTSIEICKVTCQGARLINQGNARALRQFDQTVLVSCRASTDPVLADEESCYV